MGSMENLGTTLGTPSPACALTAPQHHPRAGSDPAGCWGPPALGEAGVDKSSPHQDPPMWYSQELCRGCPWTHILEDSWEGSMCMAPM